MANDIFSQPYIDRVHSALSDNLNGFDKSPDEFKTAMQDPSYVANVHAALSDNLHGFTTPLPHFHGQVMQQDNTRNTPVPIQAPIKNYPGIPIIKRDDFDSSWLGRQAVADRVDDGMHKNYPESFKTYGPLTDLYRYFSGQPLQNKVLSISTNRPKDAKDPNAKYVSINDPEFKQQVIDNFNRAESGNLVHSVRNRLNEAKIRDNTYNISAYSQPTGGTLGHYTVSKGKDEKGDYISYYDRFDITPGNDSSWEEKLGILKPFEIYDRIYFDPKTKKIIPDDRLPKGK